MQTHPRHLSLLVPDISAESHRLGRVELRPVPLSVLVVDDDPDSAESMAELLGLAGFDARSAGSATEALNADADAPDVVILDVRMPEVDGWEFARRLTRRGNAPLLIALTGCDGDDDRRCSAEAGIHLHLLKPADPRVVIGVLRRFSGSAAIRAER